MAHSWVCTMSIMLPCELSHSTWWLFQSLLWQNVEQYGVRRHNEHSANASLLQLAHCKNKNKCIAKNIIQLSSSNTFLTSGISSLLGCNPAATLEIVSTSKSFLWEIN